MKVAWHAAYAANRTSSNLKGSTKQFGWLRASATKPSFLSAISANPATKASLILDAAREMAVV